MDYVARCEAIIVPGARRVSCTTPQRPPKDGRVRIDQIYFPYRLNKYDRLRKLAVLEVDATSEQISASGRIDQIYLSSVFIVGKYREASYEN